MSNKLKQFMLLLGDVVILYSSLYLTLFVRYQTLPKEQIWNDHFAPFSAIFLAWILILYIFNLYNLNLAINNAKFFQLIARAMIIAGLTSTAFFYLTPQITIAPKRNLLIFIAIFVLLFILWRNLFNWLLKAYIPKNNIAIVGFNNQVKQIINELKHNPHLGYNVSFLINSDGGENIKGIPVISDIAEIKKQIRKNKITSIILASEKPLEDELRLALFKFLPLKISYMTLPRFYEIVTGKIPIESINQMWFLENLSEGEKYLFDKAKRIFDFILALAVLLLSFPLWMIVGTLIKLESKGPAFFTQIRMGKNKKPFSIIKFRTMKTENNNLAPTEKKDSRITKLGSFLRKTGIDEIPQALNVLNGDMSFVGPRPERPELAKELEKSIPFYNERTLVKPGITGWDQISGEYHSPSHEDSLKKLQYDLFYIKNRSIYLDLSIILKTISAFFGRGAR